MWDPTVELTWHELREERFLEPPEEEPGAPPPLETMPEAEVEEPILALAEPEKGPEAASQ
jgi:hypothetical protein